MPKKRSDRSPGAIKPAVKKQPLDFQYLMSVAQKARETRPADAPTREQIRKELSDEFAVQYFGRIYDSDDPADGSRLDQYWQKKAMILIAKRFYGKIGRRKLPSSLEPYNPNSVAKHFGLRGIEFGNWLNQEDRLNYLVASCVGLLDLQSITGLKIKQIGFNGKLTLGLGSRGKGGRALAFFQPFYFAINLTRYNKDIKKGDHYSLMASSGGAGSLAHEWAHAFDYYLGRKDRSND